MGLCSEPGIAKLVLLPYFGKVTGIELSSSILAKAIREPNYQSLDPALRPPPLQEVALEVLRLQRDSQTGTPGKLEYLEDNALTLKNCPAAHGAPSADVPEAARVDLIFACQAAHWLIPYSQLFPLIYMVPRPKGLIFFVGYSGLFLPAYPSLPVHSSATSVAANRRHTLATASEGTGAAETIDCVSGFESHPLSLGAV
ncbi:hypothetical protein K437DRAFT_102494 [Tilletiaria anomala UBC 951]|uniref:Methyltransferase type 11 domain-containing protein n=1 Tax=Tilletiaria anomala (strain ATCC 24038 / CBS 436.72 / UBC 951) TaxID=1037660 RepID=A0A066W358_TILAU|nr:uncharacterized protein K437DRAFT_102494 [Tilletiaria anomala UBC 951]KDN46978.1 hypothetical protein K437DRAFT_102494 [Tilletiaria anomala UBC 951]